MKAREFLAGLPQRSALVVGDICLDRWCTYDPDASEPSRETGIPRVAVTSTEVTAGAGGTIANNLVALGVSRVCLLGVVGNDGYGHELIEDLDRRRISPALIIPVPGWPTFTYTKLINKRTGEEDLPRVDFISQRPLASEIEDGILANLRDFAPDFDAIFVSDQAETGQTAVVTPRVRHLLGELCVAHSKRVFWIDSRQRIGQFHHAVLKPNEQEANAACMGLFGRIDYRALREHTHAKCLIVTLGERGALVVDAAGETLAAGRHRPKPVDICGAGDAFSAAAGMALAVNAPPVEAARFGNLAASITIMKRGTGTVSPEEMLAEAGETA